MLTSEFKLAISSTIINIFLQNVISLDGAWIELSPDKNIISLA